MDCEDFEIGDAPASTGFKLRGRQQEWVDAVEADERANFSRLLFLAPGGIGKGSILGYLAKKKWEQQGIRTLVTENREHLVGQMAERIRDEIGLECDVEMAGQSASPSAPCVVASVQTLGRINRLTSFSDDHFGFVVPDECHLSLAPQPSRVLSYFHWGAESLEENWQRPKDGQYKPKSTICGFTATPNIGSGRHLSELYHRVSVNYSYLSAIEEGWLVGIEERNIPVTIDTRKFRTKRTSEGAAFNSTDQSAAIIPVIAELAKQIVREAFDRKTICFLPSVECARLMTEALKGMGMRAIFVSGECLDKSDKIDEYNAAPMGTVLCNCALVVYGIDFIDTNCIAPFSAVISKANYGQKIYRGTRVLKGVLKEGMTARERRAAIAASAKPKMLVLSPFFISDRIDICEIFDLFTDVPREKGKKPKTGGDFATPEKMRDWLAAIEKAADPHRNKQARTIDPVLYGLSIGQDRISAMAVAGDAPASREEKDVLLAFDIDTTKITSSAQAQRLIGILRERDRHGLASPKAITQLRLRLGWPEKLASKMKGKQAGVLIARGVRYSAPKTAEAIEADDPALAYGEG